MSITHNLQERLPMVNNFIIQEHPGKETVNRSANNPGSQTEGMC